MKIAVIVSDATAMTFTGADLERRVAVFNAPADLAEFVRLAELSAYATVSLAIVKEPNSAISAAPKLEGGSDA